MKVSDVVYDYSYDGSRPKIYEETADFEHVVSVRLGGGYDWDDLEAWYSPSRRKFFWLDGSGCSCNSLGDGVTSIADFDAGNRDELSSAVRRKYDESCTSYSGLASELLKDLAAVKTFRSGQARGNAHAD
jgi:hypothetical protein